MIDTLPNHNIHKKMSQAIRFLSMDAVEKAQSGHPGMPMGMADIATILYQHFLIFNPDDPHWINRDRFIVSNGHGSMLLYALAYLTGYKAMTIEQIKNFRQLGSLTPGHPEHDVTIGIETTTGPLGQGFANAVGMAIAQAKLQTEFSSDIINHMTYVFCGDGCLMEGITHEAASLAGHLCLKKLVVFFDNNEISIDGATSLSTSDDTIKRFQSYNWHTITIDGHNPQEIYNAIRQAQLSSKPTFISCKTIIGYSSLTHAGTSKVHGSPLGAEEITGIRNSENWLMDPFEVPPSILDLWRTRSPQCKNAYEKWFNNFNQLDEELKSKISQRLKKILPSAVEKMIKERIHQNYTKRPTEATRKSSGDLIELISPNLPNLIGGSADLTGSNLTKASSASIIKADDFKGTYLHYGIREHAMAACMNGIAVYGGFIPFGGTFLSFSDYCRPAIRLSALMKQQVIYIMTHDSIGLGEDGPTHQPVEHLSSLRAIPNLLVLRPADSIEVAECWLIALQQTDRPSVVCLSRQAVPTVRSSTSITQNQSLLGGYIISAGNLNTEVIVSLVATGTEVAIAIEVQKNLSNKGINAQVISMPSQELFFEQSADYRTKIIPANHLVYAIEAGSSQSWDRLVHCRDHMTTIDQFGASAPYEQLYEYFGFTPLKIALKIEKIINNLED